MTQVPAHLRQAVRQRAMDRCEYCGKPSLFSPVSFQVDHIIATKHHGSSALENLAWACFKCNNSKGSDVGSYDLVSKELTPLFNPRRNQWDEHFELKKDGMIKGLTPIGRVTIDLL